ncbi:hypothetical protein H9L10_06455 [Phycicoccus endophyticus]|uniref:Uncharacterized protein n=1 Tax=Phycicoccus endophyticus TaxID=1690220 RepID=A0A7G9R4S1_9MICO|nr:hypothetical protein [Phycicoccus endophyticus]NHI18513.1 hypothetical protein [Phycicoccus endophyticus]QNN50596.1 hypothetical protein H9L10_06455 [Phycicoccus endophyticus]
MTVTLGSDEEPGVALAPCEPRAARRPRDCTVRGLSGRTVQVMAAEPSP